jgi:acetyl-CoA synthetase
MDCIENCFET